MCRYVKESCTRKSFHKFISQIKKKEACMPTEYVVGPYQKIGTPITTLWGHVSSSWVHSDQYYSVV